MTYDDLAAAIAAMSPAARQQRAITDNADFDEIVNLVPLRTLFDDDTDELLHGPNGIESPKDQYVLITKEDEE